jgi:integrase
VTNADWWARVIQARTERTDLLPKRVWALRKGDHEAAIDLKAVPASAPRLCSQWTVSGARRGCSAHTSRPNWWALSPTRGQYSRRKGGREMRGSIKQRYRGSWSIILDLGYQPHPDTGKVRRRQKWVTFRGTRAQAEKKLTALLGTLDAGTYVDTTKITLGEWLTEWLELAAKSVPLRPSTYARYKGIIEHDMITAPIAGMPIQKIRPSHIEAYYASATVSASTLTLHHAILHRALRKAVKDHIIAVNPATDLDGKPRSGRNRDDVQEHAWSATEARVFLMAAKAAGPQPAAFYGLALDSGARKGELCGLRWADLDLEAGKMHIQQQLLTPGPEPTFGPPKTGRPRTVALGAQVVDLLRAHRKHQAEIKMANRTSYADLGLVFAKEWSDVRKRGDTLGQPLQANNLGQREYAHLIKVAGIRRIKFHGLRHTCATLLLQAGQPVHVVSERLGHSKVSMTMEVYAHVLPDMQQDAAAKLSAILHG